MLSTLRIHPIAASFTLLALALIPTSGRAHEEQVAWWMAPEIEFEIVAGAGLDRQAVIAAGQKAAAVWNEVGAGPRVAVNVGESLLETGDGKNSIVFLDDEWPWHTGQVAVAVKLTQDGRILEADILLNAAELSFTTDGEVGKFDVQNAITHELGHALGLAHSDERSATMFPTIHPGETAKRDLSEDDVAGLQAHYEGWSGDALGGCAQAPGSLWAGVLAFLPLAFRRRP